MRGSIAATWSCAREPFAAQTSVCATNRYSSGSLSRGYLEDADSLREATLEGLQPSHRCRLQTSTIPLFPKRCGIAPWRGEELVGALNAWLKYGHVIDPSETDAALNETAALADFEAAHDAWFGRECSRLVELLRTKLRAGFNELAETGSAGNETAIRVRAEAAMQATLAFVKHMPRKSMARAVEMSTFWQYPGRTATYVEKATQQQTTQCTEELFQVRRNTEARQRATGGLAPAPVVQPPQRYNASGGAAPLKLVKKSESVEFEKASQARLARIRARSKMLTGNDIKLEHQIGRAREECFVVFD